MHGRVKLGSAGPALVRAGHRWVGLDTPLISPSQAPGLRSSWKLQGLGRMRAPNKGEPETLSQRLLGQL